MKVQLICRLFVGKIFAGKSSYESDSSSFVVAASEKVLVPGSKTESSSSLTEQSEAVDTTLDDHQVCEFASPNHLHCYTLVDAISWKTHVQL